jgi:hypothetical protein
MTTHCIALATPILQRSSAVTFARYPSFMNRNLLFSDYSSGSPVSQNGSNFPHSRHAIAQFAKRQIHRLLSPRLRYIGGCSRISRRFFANFRT